MISIIPLMIAPSAMTRAITPKESRGRLRISTPIPRASKPRAMSAHQVRRCSLLMASIKSRPSSDATPRRRLVFLSQSRLFRKEFGQIANLLVRKGFCHRIHDGILAGAVAILQQRLNQIVVLLTGQARSIRSNGLLATRSVTGRAYGIRFRIFRVLVGGGRRQSGREQDEGV